jgi:hypothetical protein
MWTAAGIAGVSTPELIIPDGGCRIGLETHGFGTGALGAPRPCSGGSHGKVVPIRGRARRLDGTRRTW